MISAWSLSFSCDEEPNIREGCSAVVNIYQKQRRQRCVAMTALADFPDGLTQHCKRRQHELRSLSPIPSDVKRVIKKTSNRVALVRECLCVRWRGNLQALKKLYKSPAARTHLDECRTSGEWRYNHFWQKAFYVVVSVLFRRLAPIGALSARQEAAWQ